VFLKNYIKYRILKKNLKKPFIFLIFFLGKLFMYSPLLFVRRQRQSSECTHNPTHPPACFFVLGGTPKCKWCGCVKSCLLSHQKTKFVMGANQHYYCLNDCACVCDVVTCPFLFSFFVSLFLFVVICDVPRECKAKWMDWIDYIVCCSWGWEMAGLASGWVGGWWH
jgi:hypothetical protein